MVRFRLSPEGKVALKGLFERESISAFVESVDELGVWIHLGSAKKVRVGQPTALMLLKWDYFSTAVLDYEPERPAKREQMGFRT